jgi:hypothetical protein
MIDETLNLGFLDGVFRGCGAGGGSIFAGECCAVSAEGETLEEGTPSRIDGFRLVQPIAVGELDDFEIGAGGHGEGIHGNERTRGLAAKAETLICFMKKIASSTQPAQEWDKLKPGFRTRFRVTTTGVKFLI